MATTGRGNYQNLSSWAARGGYKWGTQNARKQLTYAASDPAHTNVWVDWFFETSIEMAGSAILVVLGSGDLTTGGAGPTVYRRTITSHTTHNHHTTLN